MSFKQILDNVSNIEDLDNVTILKTLQKFSEAIKDFAEQQSGLQNLINVEFIPTENSVTYADGVVDYLGALQITLSDNIIVNKPCSVKFNIKGSETIVVDVDEFDNALEIHLDSDIINKIDRALLLPLTPPSTSKLVGVDTTNSQNLLSVGENLVIEDDTLKLDNKIEKVEVVYDSTSSDSNINKGYTSGILGGNSVNMNFAPYKKLRIYTHFATSNGFGVIDFTRTVDTYSGEYPYISNITASSSNDLKEVAFMLCLINTAKSKILINEAGVTNGTNLIDKKNNNSYVVYKIEGVY